MDSELNDELVRLSHENALVYSALTSMLQGRYATVNHMMLDLIRMLVAENDRLSKKLIEELTRSQAPRFFR